MGYEHKIERMVGATEKARSVAVIRGGPAGMRAAMDATDRGHSVTLYEKGHRLGGLLLHADHASFKWPVRDYKDWLVSQVYKRSVDVRQNAEVTPELLKVEKFDVVIAAIGAVPKVPDISGARGANVWSAPDVYGNEKKLGKRVVVIGGSETGTEVGLYLAQCGHEVTVLTRQGKLASDAQPVHFYESMQEAFEGEPNFSYELRATCTRITDAGVTYTDAGGAERSIPADTVVLLGGMAPKQDEAIALSGFSDRFFVIGDCYKVGNIQTCSRTAFTAAAQI